MMFCSRRHFICRLISIFCVNKYGVIYFFRPSWHIVALSWRLKWWMSFYLIIQFSELELQEELKERSSDAFRSCMRIWIAVDSAVKPCLIKLDHLMFSSAFWYIGHLKTSKKGWRGKLSNSTSDITRNVRRSSKGNENTDLTCEVFSWKLSVIKSRRIRKINIKHGDLPNTCSTQW